MFDIKHYIPSCYTFFAFAAELKPELCHVVVFHSLRSLLNISFNLVMNVTCDVFGQIDCNCDPQADDL